MWDEIAGAYGSRFFLAAGGVGIALLLLICILWIFRNRAPSPFVRGGKNRQPRLQVLDAAAVDARRRLVLVRRDGIEHLIMIGGPTDIVIESGISDAAKAGMPAPTPVGTPLAYERRLEPAQEAPRLDHLPATASEPPVLQKAAVEAYMPPEPSAAVEPAHLHVAPAAERPQPALAPQQRTPESVAMLGEAEVADILDAARRHVLPQEPARVAAAPQPVHQPMAASPQPIRQPIAPAVASAPPVVAPPPVREPGADFQRILEAEMSNNLTAERIIPNVPQRQIQQPAASPAQRRDPELPPMTGADTALQKEVARIFGEMSVNRDK
ncbi:flagellar biosynthetic protein FliO [Rhizobium sp. CB3171]|uniref:flagellar biosynthetic protein FliO n=1 Tax=Rhizobium sp. CB3171 TaxID=3039157 RepID=UPI0024B25995|nr:flagellar biosynthetic protein FliO [Rhizobium sp. CB3171]WFU03610.1 flagellar biosynthetic protein FliO [Rhizobium sp. CB3171]